ncbi:MAG: hypothetical protein IT378_11575 [Sandaracinaceae bacterium]|nr:hypothetical protein [Sandaracinaceae bacterium]
MLRLLALLCLLAPSLAPTAQAQAPRWPLDTVPIDPTQVGVTATLHLTRAGATVTTLDQGEAPVADAAACEARFEGALRGYRRRFGMRRSAGGATEHGGTGALDARVVAAASLPVSRLAALVTSSGYSGWARRIALVVAMRDDQEATLPVAFVDRPDRAGVVVSGSATFQALVDAIARVAPTRRVAVHVRR